MTTVNRYGIIVGDMVQVSQPGMDWEPAVVLETRENDLLRVRLLSDQALASVPHHASHPRASHANCYRTMDEARAEDRQGRSLADLPGQAGAAAGALLRRLDLDGALKAMDSGHVVRRVESGALKGQCYASRSRAGATMVIWRLTPDGWEHLGANLDPGAFVIADDVTHPDREPVIPAPMPSGGKLDEAGDFDRAWALRSKMAAGCAVRRPHWPPHRGWLMDAKGACYEFNGDSKRLPAMSSIMAALGQGVWDVVEFLPFPGMVTPARGDADGWPISGDDDSAAYLRSPRGAWWRIGADGTASRMPAGWQRDPRGRGVASRTLPALTQPDPAALRVMQADGLEIHPIAHGDAIIALPAARERTVAVQGWDWAMARMKAGLVVRRNVEGADNYAMRSSVIWERAQGADQLWRRLDVRPPIDATDFILSDAPHPVDVMAPPLSSWDWAQVRLDAGAAVTRAGWGAGYLRKAGGQIERVGTDGVVDVCGCDTLRAFAGLGGWLVTLHRLHNGPPLPPGGHAFGWALAKMRQGHAVRRKGWNRADRLALHGAQIQCAGGLVEWAPTQSNLLAHDWELAP